MQSPRFVGVHLPRLGRFGGSSSGAHSGRRASWSSASAWQGLSRRRLVAAGAGAVAICSAAVAAATRGERRYLGYRAADDAQPYARFMRPRVETPQPHVPEAIARGPVPTADIPPRSALGDELARPGYSPIETGFGRTARGEVWVACLTDMPGVDPEMWDWWFAWHSHEGARYKLWHPEAHAYASVRGTTSYVDEAIGGKMDQLAITFVEPREFGIDDAEIDGFVACGRVGSAFLPANVGMVAHAVRRTPTGSEMRSRFYLNVPGARSVDPIAVLQAFRRGLVLPGSPIFPTRFGAELLRHCGEEMNHLAQFLPELYAEFGDAETRLSAIRATA